MGSNVINIPKSFSIAGLNFTVEVVDNISDGSIYGQWCDCDSKIIIANRIKIDNVWKEIPYHIKCNTFLHELFHVFNYYYNTESSEALAQTFANFMYEFLKSKEE